MNILIRLWIFITPNFASALELLHLLDPDFLGSYFSSLFEFLCLPIKWDIIQTPKDFPPPSPIKKEMWSSSGICRVIYFTVGRNLSYIFGKGFCVCLLSGKYGNQISPAF